MNELPERDATGAIAVIYDEIRRFCSVPYVSLMPCVRIEPLAREEPGQHALGALAIGGRRRSRGHGVGA